jgi:hypothetical protein
MTERSGWWAALKEVSAAWLTLKRYCLTVCTLSEWVVLLVALWVFISAFLYCIGW